MHDKVNHKRIVLRLSNGVTSLDELKELVDIYSNKYKESGKDILIYIEYQCFNELLRRLKTSVFGESGKNYPVDFKKYSISAEYYNTKLLIDTTKKIISIGLSSGDLTKPEFYGQPDAGYVVSMETLIHILLRHNNSFNGFISKDSKENGYNPSSFGFGVFAEPMLTMFMALNSLEGTDWKKAVKGKNLICHFALGSRYYTLTRNGTSKEIKSFYLRNDELDAEYVKLKRKSNEMSLLRE